MFQLYTYNFIDTIQTTKKILVDTFVKHEMLAKTLHKFVDAQTEYTKNAVDTMFIAANELYDTCTDSSFIKDYMHGTHIDRKEK